MTGEGEGKKSRRWLILGLLAVLVAAGVGAYFYTSREKPPAWVTQPVRRGDVVQVVSATGIIQPVVLSPVGSQVSGIVWKIHADYNDLVKKGQVLVELDPALFQSAVAQQEANLAAAEADVRKSQAGLQNASLAAGRARALAEKHYIAAADRDTADATERQAKAEVASSQARVMQMRAMLQKARLDLKNSVVLSPVDGVVIARSVELGQAVVASFQAPNLFTIAQDLSKMQVLANVDEADIGTVRVGQTAQFTVDSYRPRRFSALVAQVRNAAQTVQNVVTYIVVLNVDNSDLLLRPGMTANVRMEVARRDNVLVVQSAALRFRPPRTEGKEADVPRPGRSGAAGGGADAGGGPGASGGGPAGGGGPGVGGGPAGGGGPGGGGGPAGGGGPGAGGGRAAGGDGAGGGPGGGGGRSGGGGGGGRAGRGARDPSRGTVYVPDGAGLRAVPVTIGITDGVITEITGGLNEGDNVVVDVARAAPSSAPGGSNPFGPPQAPRGGMRRGGF